MAATDNMNREDRPNFASFVEVFKGSATLVIKQEKVQDFKKEVFKIIGPTREEAGNISYEAFQILDKEGNETNRFEFHELWINERAMMIDHKEQAAHMKKFFELLNIGDKNSMVESFVVDGARAKALIPNFTYHGHKT